MTYTPLVLNHQQNSSPATCLPPAPAPAPQPAPLPHRRPSLHPHPPFSPLLASPLAPSRTGDAGPSCTRAATLPRTKRRRPPPAPTTPPVAPPCTHQGGPQGARAGVPGRGALQAGALPDGPTG
ncbi:hypothetical protein GQ55_3G223300 [Panicum hallii var. hallii]|uniref:Uncharacterized protein n=1 Tax=Panicum hallii var. hallii TaxID=1504633 RepID=A0A2T7EC83_9POAL|nr:hypothetical protein GQ55_3G223300 [Panicum hallii var. hallii]